MKRGRSSRAGLTVMEVLLAVVVLSFVSMALFAGLASGSRLGGRSERIERATDLARGEVQRVQTAAALSTPDEIGDSTYETSYQGILFIVTRTCISGPAADTARTLPPLREYLINVRIGDQDEPAVTCCFIQGFAL